MDQGSAEVLQTITLADQTKRGITIKNLQELNGVDNIEHYKEERDLTFPRMVNGQVGYIVTAIVTNCRSSSHLSI